MSTCDGIMSLLWDTPVIWFLLMWRLQTTLLREVNEIQLLGQLYGSVGKGTCHQSGDLIFIPGTHMLEGEKLIFSNRSLTHTQG